MIAWTNLLYIRLEWKNEISLKAATLQNKKTVTVVQTEIQIMLLLLSPVPPNICWAPMQVNSAACLILTSAPVNFPDMPLQMVQQFKQLKWKKKKKKSFQRTHCEVQLIPLSQSSEPVQAAALVVILEELDEA